MNHLLAGQAHGGFLTRMFVHDARLFLAVQIQPAPHVMRFNKIIRHDAGANQRFHATNHALTGDTRLEHDLVQEKFQLIRPMFRRDLNPHGFGKVVDTEHHVLDGVVLHQIRGDFQRLGMFDNRLNADVAVQADQKTGQVAHLRRTIRLARFGQHNHVDVLGHVAHQRHVQLIFIGAERVNADGHADFAVAGKFGQLHAQQLAAHGLLPTTIFQVENQRMGIGLMGVLLHTQRRRFQILINPQRRGVLDRRVIQLNAGPSPPQRTDVRRCPAVTAIAELFIGVVHGCSFCSR